MLLATGLYHNTFFIAKFPCLLRFTSLTPPPQETFGEEEVSQHFVLVSSLLPGTPASTVGIHRVSDDRASFSLPSFSLTRGVFHILLLLLLHLHVTQSFCSLFLKLLLLVCDFSLDLPCRGTSSPELTTSRSLR